MCCDRPAWRRGIRCVRLQIHRFLRGISFGLFMRFVDCDWNAEHHQNNPINKSIKSVSTWGLPGFHNWKNHHLMFVSLSGKIMLLPALNAVSGRCKYKNVHGPHQMDIYFKDLKRCHLSCDVKSHSSSNYWLLLSMFLPPTTNYVYRGRSKVMVGHIHAASSFSAFSAVVNMSLCWTTLGWLIYYLFMDKASTGLIWKEKVVIQCLSYRTVLAASSYFLQCRTHTSAVEAVPLAFNLKS